MRGLLRTGTGIRIDTCAPDAAGEDKEQDAHNGGEIHRQGNFMGA